MTTIPSNTTVSSEPARLRPAVAAGTELTAAAAAAAQGETPAVSISSFAARLGRAGNGAGAGLAGQALADHVRASVDRINYPLTPENKRRMAQEVPEPADAAALASAQAATEYVDRLGGRNPFAGLPREQLWTIANDDTGTFTTNERYAAYRQAYDEEQAWRTQAVAAAMREYHETGKLTSFFQSALDHFNTLPAAEQALYPDDYAAGLQDKVDLDFNYFTHRPHGQSGVTPGSIADIVGRDTPRGAAFELPDIFPRPVS